jgi:virginiamycin B lyase
MTIRVPLARLAMISIAAAIILALAGSGAWWLAGQGSRARFVEYPMPRPGEMPIAITAAADGTVWFTIDGAAALGRVRDGRLEELPKAGKSVEPLGIAATADGSVWYTDMAASAVARMTWKHGGP